MANTISMGTLYLGRNPARPVVSQCSYPCHRPAISLGDTVPGKEINWVLVNGILIASRSILRNVPWPDLVGCDLVSGGVAIIDGSTYRCRLLRTHGGGVASDDEWELAKRSVGSDNHMWNLDEGNSTFWTLGPKGPELRGGGMDDYKRTDFSWRPVLDVLELNFSQLDKGEYVQLGGGQSLIQGFLKEETDYDLILDSAFSEVYLGNADEIVSKVEDGRLVVNKSALTVARKASRLGKEKIWLSAV